MLWLYYQFMSEYKTRPADIDDMIAGLSCLWARNEIEEVVRETQ